MSPHPTSVSFPERFLRVSAGGIALSGGLISLVLWLIGRTLHVPGVLLGIAGALAGLGLQRLGHQRWAARVFLLCNAAGMALAAGVVYTPEGIGASGTGYILLACLGTVLLSPKEYLAFGVVCELGTIAVCARMLLAVPEQTALGGATVAVTFVATAFTVLGLITQNDRATIQRLQEAEQAAVEASAAKSHFLANMSHELRTPLNAIIGYAELVIEEAEELPSPELTDDVKRIERAGRHLLGLINNLLDLAKVEAGRMEAFVEPCHPARLVQEVAQGYRPLLAERDNRLVLDLEGGLVLHTDTTKLRQILINLIDNANKFTQAGTISVRLKAVEGGAVLQVQDTGIGIAPEHQAHLFHPFTQAESSTTRRFGGTGLGLSLVKTFAELLEGHVELDSTLGEGTTFSVHLKDLPQAG